MEDNNKDDDDYNVISALEVDRDMGFSRGHQGNQAHRPHDDDNKEEDNEEEDNEVEDNDKDDDNNKDDNDDKDSSAQGLDRDLGFSGGHEGHKGHRPHDDDDEEEDDEEMEENDNYNNHDKWYLSSGTR